MPTKPDCRLPGLGLLRRKAKGKISENSGGKGRKLAANCENARGEKLGRRPPDAWYINLFSKLTSNTRKYTMIDRISFFSSAKSNYSKICVLYVDNSLIMKQVEEAGVPVKRQDEIVDQGHETQEVGVVGVPFRAVHEGPELVDLDEAEDPEDGLEPQGEVEEVEGQEAEAVDVEGRGVHVVLPELRRVRLEDAVLRALEREGEREEIEIDGAHGFPFCKPPFITRAVCHGSFWWVFFMCTYEHFPFQGIQWYGRYAS